MVKRKAASDDVMAGPRGGWGWRPREECFCLWCRGEKSNQPCVIQSGMERCTFASVCAEGMMHIIIMPYLSFSLKHTDAQRRQTNCCSRSTPRSWPCYAPLAPSHWLTDFGELAANPWPWSGFQPIDCRPSDCQRGQIADWFFMYHNSPWYRTLITQVVRSGSGVNKASSAYGLCLNGQHRLKACDLMRCLSRDAD